MLLVRCCCGGGGGGGCGGGACGSRFWMVMVVVFVLYVCAGVFVFVLVVALTCWYALIARIVVGSNVSCGNRKP